MRNPTRLLTVMVVSAALPVCAQAAEQKQATEQKQVPEVKQAAEMKHVPNLKWNGFLDFTFMLSDGTWDTTPATPSPYENKFDMNGELDLNTTLGNKVTARMDFDLGKVDNTVGGNADSGRFEQAFVNWESPKGLQLTGGLMNNPLGWEAEDAPDMYQISHGQLYTVWDGWVTGLSGNNVIGAAVSGKAGVATLTGAFLNDLGQVDEQNSFMGLVNFKPDNRVDLEIGFVTQDAGLESIVDFNGTYTQGLFMVGAEVMLASEVIDMGFGITGVYKFSEQVSGTLRVDNVSYDIPNVDDTNSVTFAVGYMLDKNLMANAEARINNANDTGLVVEDGDQVQVELVATF